MKDLLRELPDCDTLFYCGFCQEEYTLPEEIEACPVCLCESLKVVA